MTTSIRHTTGNVFGLMATPATACMAAQGRKVRITVDPKKIDDENTAYLPELIRECERLGLDLQLTDDPAVNLPEIKAIDGRRTVIAQADEIGVALDDVRTIGRCITCGSLLDDTAVLYFPANALPSFRACRDLTGADVKTCRPCVEASGLPLTAAQRGSEWLARWGCPEFCVEEHGKPGALECHSTLVTETKLLAADVDCSGYSTNGEELPWMTAQVVVNNDKSQAYGRQTRVWLGYGVHLAELSPAKARKALEEMRVFVGRLEAVVQGAEAIAEGDFAGDPEVARLDTEATDARVKRVTEADAFKA